MFVHTGLNLPQEPQYKPDLEELGFRVRKNGKIVSTADGTPFLFYHTSNERANEARKEAMHESVRKIVAGELKQIGVDEVYLGGADGKEVLGIHRETKPYEYEEEPHVTILASQVLKLFDKRDVIVVIGDPGEDAGVWAWRHVLGDGGINGGSAVGLAKKMAFESDDFKTIEEVHEATKGAEQQGGEYKASGLIILNPGALYWSNIESKTMTWPTWRARARKYALGEDYVIDEEHNYVPGHGNPQEHIETCLDYVLPQILELDAQIYVIAISTSAEYFIDWYKKRTATSYVAPGGLPGIQTRVAAVALIEPTHNAKTINCKATEKLLNEHGQQWTKSQKPVGTLLDVPETMVNPPALPFLPGTKHCDPRLPEYSASVPASDASEDNSNSDSDKTITASTFREPTTSELTTATAAESDVADPSEVHDLYDKVDSMTLADLAEWRSNNLPLQTKTEEEDDDADEVSSLVSYDHTTEIVNCPTYSGKTDIDEMIWPNAIEKVLQFFEFQAEKNNRF